MLATSTCGECSPLSPVANARRQHLWRIARRQHLWRMLAASACGEFSHVSLPLFLPLFFFLVGHPSKVLKQVAQV